VRRLKQATLILALLGTIVLAACGNSDTTSQSNYNNGTGDQPFKPVTHLAHRSVVSNYYAGDLQVMDAYQNRLTAFTFATGAQPTYLQSSPDGLYTFVNDTGSSSISTLDNKQEKVRATIALGGPTQSFVTSTDDQFAFAAVPSYNNGNTPILPGAINRFNPYDGSLNTAIPFPYATYLAMDPAEKHLLVFTVGDTAASGGDDNVYYLDLTTNDPSTGYPAISVLTLPAGALSRPVAAFFSADSSTAYILNCGAECGGFNADGSPATASVTEINAISSSCVPLNCPATPVIVGFPSIHPASATVVKQWMVSGARRGLIDLTANNLYVVGSTMASTAIDCPFAQLPACASGTGGNNVQDGYFTTINLAAGTASAPIRIGNGAKLLIRSIGKNFWVSSVNCGIQSCITIVNPAATANPATVLANPYGNGTGVSLQTNSGEVYTIEGGQLYMYTQSGTQIIPSNYSTDIRGQGYDVLYID
jgi:hypothetical protein